MASYEKPKQGPEQIKIFSSMVSALLKEKGWNAALLAKKSNLSKTTISRILRNDNDKGSTYQPTANIVTAVSLAFELDEDGWNELMLAAFPQIQIWHEGIKRHLSIDDVNEALYEQGLPLLGNTNDE